MATNELERWADEFYGEPVRPERYDCDQRDAEEMMLYILTRGEKRMRTVDIRSEVVQKPPESH